MAAKVSVQQAMLDAVTKATDTISLTTLGSVIEDVESEYVHAWNEIRAAWRKSAEDIGYNLSNPQLYAALAPT
jgi:hypothetical protein